MNTKKNFGKNAEISGPDLRPEHTCGGMKPVNGFPII
jgi:hypothetical protein